MRIPSRLSIFRVLGLLVFLALLSSALPLAINAAPLPQQTTSVYHVQYGDTLYTIAQKFNTTVQAIMTANGLTNYYLYVGQRLIVPSAPIPPGPLFACTYTVQYRDTLYSIGYRYNVPWYQLMQANYLYYPWIYVGQQLKVPCHTPAPTPFPSYTVVPGDNLFRIAIKYGTSVYAIALVNGIWNPHWIFAGQTLVIPYPGTVVWPTTVPAPLTPTLYPFTPGLLTPTPTATATTPSSNQAVVVMANITYIPNTVTISKGGSVLWKNTDSVTHTVSSGVPGALDNKFRSGALGPGQQFSFQFNDAGTFQYFSELDSGMTGSVTVQ